MHIDYGVKANCYNPMDSYGEICTWCNCCGRVDKNTMYQCRIAIDKQHLQDEVALLFDAEYQNSQSVILKNCEYHIKRIKRSIKKLEVSDE
jgi:hypothetical protein